MMFFAHGSHEREIFQQIQEVSEELGVKSYLVGGFVRDRILARQSKDIDIVCVGDGIELATRLAGRLRPIPNVTVYKRFGTAMLRHLGMEIEFVGARKESYRADSRKPSVEVGSLQDDQNRRDFTINALAVKLGAQGFGEIIDPFGGLHHLEEKLIKTPTDPIKTFADDPLRMLRAIRFATQLDFWIEEKTLKAISDCRNRIKIVSQERITIEINKIIESFEPSRGFRLLEKTGLLELVLPDMARLKGVEIRKGIGHKDNFYHTLQVLDNLSLKSESLWLRWAAILHDIAKPATKRFDPKAGWTFHGHEALGAAMVPRIFRKMRLPLDGKMKFVQKMVRLHLRPIGLSQDHISDSAVRRLLFDAGDEIEELLMLCEADITSKNDSKVERYLQNYQILRSKLKEIEEKDHLRNWEPPVSGEIIMETFGIKPSRSVGVIKKAIREAILDGQIANDYEAAFAFMLEKGREIGLELPAE